MSLKSFVVLFIALLTVTTACRNDVQFSGSESGSNVDVNPPDPGTIVCDPFDDNIPYYNQMGLKGSFYYLTPEMPRFNFVSEYIALGRQVPDRTIYLNRLFVPTRPFDRGFTTQAGATLMTEAGDTLYEWFALKLESKIKLGAQDTHVGNYQLAFLADDGAVLRIEDSDLKTMNILINDDDVHPTRFKVAMQPVNLSRASRIPIEVQYFQGPRYHISLILMWRPWPANPADVADPLDGYTSNNDFFDSTQNPPAPQARYQELLSRGWKPLEADNFVLKEGINPCVYPTPGPTAPPTPAPTPKPTPTPLPCNDVVCD